MVTRKGKTKTLPSDAKPVADAARDEPGRVPFRVLRPVEHDGQRYAVGDTLELDAAVAAPLLTAGALDADAGTAPDARG